jgi:hypothetical protein
MGVLDGIADYMIRHKIGRISELIGSLETDFPVNC